jgi:hypothetical protein
MMMADFSSALDNTVEQNDLKALWQLLEAWAGYHPAPGQSPLLSVAMERGYKEIAALALARRQDTESRRCIALLLTAGADPDAGRKAKN